VAGFGSIWVANGPSRTVTRIDPITDTATAVIAVPDPASVMTTGAGSVWVTSFPGNTVTRIDPATNTVLATIPSGGLGPIGITFFDGHVWVANHNGNPTGSLAKIDPATMTVVDVIPVGAARFDSGPVWLAAAAGSLWTGVPNLAAVVRIDPTTDTIAATIPDQGVCGSIVATDSAVWVAGGGGPGCLPGITRIDPATNTIVVRFNAGGQTGPLALGAGSLWYGTLKSNLLGRADTTTDAIIGGLKLPGPADKGLTVAYGAVWATDSENNLLYRIQPS
jgi:YVTN family beta-propeller protein